MIIYPAIDLMNGECVRLRQGDFKTREVFHTNPIEVAKSFESKGCKYLHVVDLDGAKAKEPVHTALIRAICQETDLKVQSGGGLRTIGDAQNLAECGVHRVVLGSIAVNDQGTTESIIEALGGERITLAIDVQPKEGKYLVATSGWQETSNLSAEDVVLHYEKRGVRDFLCTDISKDGMMSGPGFPLYRQLQDRFPKLAFQASGGIRNQDDLKKLKDMDVDGAIIGKALYQETLTVEEALSC